MFTDQEKLEFNFYPRPAVEHVFKTGKYVPEIITAIGQFVVSEPKDSREEALEVATSAANALANSMLKTAKDFIEICNFKKAKGS